MNHSKDIIYYMNRVYAKNLTTTSGGNLSEMDAEGNIYITPSGKDKGTLKPEDVCIVHPDGSIEGEYKPSIELPFHTLLYKIRPDIKAVLHVHSPMLVTYSLFNGAPLIDVLPESYKICGKVGLSRYDIPGSIELGRQIAGVIEEGGYDSIMMENHGVVLIAKDMKTAYDRLETLENIASINLRAHMLGGSQHRLTVKDMKRYARKVAYEYTSRTAMTAKEESLRTSMCEFSRRCYVHDFFNVAAGTIACRLDEHSFLITPARYDRYALRPSQIVKVTDGKCEQGKRADKMYTLVRDIFASQSYVESVMMAVPQNIMAYATTGTPIDSRTIPESYINMRDVVRMPYCSDIENTEELVNALSPASPIVLVENSRLITTGETLTKAFDRLEVTEVTAKTLVLSHILGTPTNISDAEIAKIDKTFALPPVTR